MIRLFYVVLQGECRSQFQDRLLRRASSTSAIMYIECFIADGRYDQFPPKHCTVRGSPPALLPSFLPSFSCAKQGSFVQQQQQTVARWTAAAAPRKTRGGGAAGALSMESTADFKNGMTIDIDGARG